MGVAGQLGRLGRPVLKHCDGFPFLLCLITVSDKIAAIFSGFNLQVQPSKPTNPLLSLSDQPAEAATIDSYSKGNFQAGHTPICPNACSILSGA